MSNDHIKHRRLQMFHKQRGKCHWCKCDTELPPAVHQPGPAPHNMATLDHLRDRFDPTRSVPARGESRYVMACWLCNSRRGAAAVRAQPVAVIRLRSQRSRQPQREAA